MSTQEVNEADNAARAFEDLRAEVSVLRRAVEQLPAAWTANKAPDYTPSLAAITEGLQEVSERIEGMEDHPALKLTPAQHLASIAHCGNEVVGLAVRRLDEAKRDHETQAKALAAVMGEARSKNKQLKWMVVTGMAALALGIVTSPFIAARLPLGWNGRVAALIMRTDRWRAAEAMMRADDPSSWAAAVAMIELGKTNAEALGACREAAAKTKKEQHCSLVVPVPTTQ